MGGFEPGTVLLVGMMLGLILARRLEQLDLWLQLWLAQARHDYQLVSWFPQWQGLGFHRLNPEHTDMAMIYEWWLWLGWWELRRWSSQSEGHCTAEQGESNG